MKNFVISLIVILVLSLLGSVAIAEDSWQTLKGVQAISMNAEEMEAIQGKDINWDFYSQNGIIVNFGSGIFAGFYMSDPVNDSFIVSINVNGVDLPIINVSDLY